MNVDLMRKIDFWVGVPLCFLLTLAFRFSGKRKTRSSLRKVLFVELSEMGSAILVDPAMRKLRDQHTCNIFFVIFKKNRQSLFLLNTVDEDNIFTIREDSLLPLAVDTVRFFLWTRKNKIDTVIDLELFSRFTAILSRLAGAHNRVGFYSFFNEGLYRGEFLTHQVMYNPHIHIARNFVALVNSVVSEKKEVPFSKSLVTDDDIKLAKRDVTKQEKENLLEKLEGKVPNFGYNRDTKIVLINPNASELLIQRRWMPEHYVSLMQMILSNHPETIVLITGSPAEREEADGLKRMVDRERCHSIAGILEFLELPALYAASHLMVTNDSGPGHFSAVTGLPTVVIFGPETPALYGSLGNSLPIYAGLACSPCVSASNHRKTACTDNVCLKVIKPLEVYNKIEPIIQEKGWTRLKGSPNEKAVSSPF